MKWDPSTCVSLANSRAVRGWRAGATGATLAALALFLISASVAPQPANAQLAQHNAQGSAFAGANGLTELDLQTDQQFGNNEVASIGAGAGRSAINAVASSSSTAVSGLKHVSLFAGASAGASDGAFANGTSFASGRTQSTFIINLPALAGTQGSFDFSVEINGDLGATRTPGGNARASVQYTLTVGTIVPIRENSQILNGVQTSSPGFTLGPQTFTTTFTYGNPIGFDLIATITANAGAQSSLGGGSSAGATANFANTFAWNGILDVRDAAGLSVLNYTALDSEGADWSTPFRADTGTDVVSVPEPATLWLFGFGLAGLGLAARRRRTQ